MTKIATRQWILNNIGGGAWSTDLTKCPTYTEIMNTGEYDVSGTYLSNQLVKQSDISLLQQNYKVTIYGVPSSTVVNFVRYNSDGTYTGLGYSAGNSNGTLTRTFYSTDEWDGDISDVEFWLTSLDSTLQPTRCSGIYCLDYGNGSGPVLLDHYDITPLTYSGQIFYDNGDIPSDVKWYITDGESIDNFSYEITITGDKVANFNYSEHSASITFINDTGDDLTISLEDGAGQYDFPADETVTIYRPSNVNDGINIYINFLQGYTDVSDQLYFKYDGTPGHTVSPWGGYFSSQIYSTDLYTINRGPIMVTWR